jgi:CDP-diglyceride synthetase
MLKTRIITAIALISALMPVLFFTSTLVWAAIMLVVSIATIYEWARLIMPDCFYHLLGACLFLLLDGQLLIVADSFFSAFGWTGLAIVRFAIPLWISWAVVSVFADFFREFNFLDIVGTCFISKIFCYP